MTIKNTSINLRKGNKKVKGKKLSQNPNPVREPGGAPVTSPMDFIDALKALHKKSICTVFWKPFLQLLAYTFFTLC